MSIRISAVLFVIACTAVAQSPDPRAAFQSRCSGCHGTDGNGGEHGPSILAGLQRRTDPELTAFLHEGVPLRGMPAFGDVPEPEMRALVGYLRTLATPRGRGGRGMPIRTKAQLTTGKALEGVEIGRTSRELQLRTDDQRIHLLRKAGEQFREVTSESDWASYHGQFSGNRYTAMTQIDKANGA